MLTTCPECQTTFRIGQAQLDVRRGLVRCGSCHAVFNAFDALLPEFQAPPAESNPDIPPPAQKAAPVVERETAASVLISDPVSHAETAPVQKPVATSLYDQVDILEEELEEDILGLGLAQPPVDAVQLSSAVSGAGASSESSDAILLSELPNRRPARSRVGVWRVLLLAVIGVLLAVLLPIQVMYFLRAEIAERQPDLRPYLVAACRPLGCELPTSRRLDALRVEASSLETDPEQQAHARFRVTFSNRSRVVQAWPLFLLKLTDANNQPIAQRALLPKEYLPKDKQDTEGIGPMSEQEFQLELDIGSLVAAGYEVKPYYP